MKKIIVSLTLIVVITALVASFSGCTNLSVEDGIESLHKAYNNTKDNYNDIYQYTEKIYKQSTAEEDGLVINRKVNVTCAVDKDYNLLKDTNYGITLHEDKYLESKDASAKISSELLAFNDIIVGETTANGSNDSVNALFVSSTLTKDKDKKREGFCTADVKAKDFYNSEYFKSRQLMNTQVMDEVAMLDASNMNFDIEKGGIVKKGVTVDYNFKMTDDYLTKYEAKYGKPSLFVGKRVWIQTSYDRISNIYVYMDENLGSGLSVEYESYIFMITYLGPKMSTPKYTGASEDKPTYEISNVFDGNNFSDGILADVSR